MSFRAILLVTVACVLPGCSDAPHENLIHVIAEQAPGLKKSARVQFRGVDVGLVKEVYFTPSGVRIDLLMLRGDVPVRAQDTVRIKSAGAFGEQVVDIQPGNQAAPLITGGDTLAKAQPESTISLPVGAWRSIVKTLGLKSDSAAAGAGAKPTTP